MKTRTLDVRRFPYPYRAGLSIANDCEFMSLEFLELLLLFCNTGYDTALGKGLALPLSSSFFFFSANPHDTPYYILNGNYNLSSPPWQENLRKLCLSGYLDTIHSYGNFDKDIVFSRSLSELALGESEKYGLRFLVYSNHGNAKNIQNMGGEAGYHEGDLVGSPSYHADITIRHGVRFLWSDGLVVEKSKGRIHEILQIGRKWGPPGGRSLLKEDHLRDGQKIIKFYRFRGTGRYAPNLSSLEHQLSALFLGNLVAERAAVVIYQHLGILYKTGDHIVPATLDGVRNQPCLLAPLRRLSDYYHDGSIWVERLATFLNFFYWRDKIQPIWHENRVEIISCVPVDVEKAGEELQYQTIYVEYDCPLEVSFKGSLLPFVYNGPDETGRYSITISPKTKENIWR